MKIDTKSLIKKLDKVSLRALEEAINLAFKQKMQDVTLAHWLAKIVECSDSIFCTMLKKSDINPDDFLSTLKGDAYDTRGSNTNVPSFASSVTTLINDSWMLASVDYHSQEINSGHILICLVSNLSLFYVNSLTKTLLKAIDPSFLRNEFQKLLDESSIHNKDTNAHSEPSKYSGGRNKSLQNFTTDLLEQAKNGKLDRAIGRAEELSQVIDILCRRKQNNPILVGDAGVGKTAIAEELAFCILEGNVPDFLKDASLRNLDFTALQAGANVQGEFESRIKDLLKDIESSPQKIVLFVDEIHTFLGSSGKAAEAANLLKPALSKGLSLIGATTWPEYKKSFEKDAALNRRFQLIKVQEPSGPSSVNIMRKVANVLEKHHEIFISDEALFDAVSLTTRYVNHLRLPDKAVALLDSACTQIRLQQSSPPIFIKDLKEDIDNKKLLVERMKKDFEIPEDKIKTLEEEIIQKSKEYETHNTNWKQQAELVQQLLAFRKSGNKEGYFNLKKRLSEMTQNSKIEISDTVTGNVIADILSKWTKIPISKKTDKEELEQLLTFDEKIQQRVIGQSHAIAKIVDTIRISKAGIADSRKPIGVFLLVGESGVGKTETALSIAETVYGHESKIITINMSEYKEGHKVASLIGSPPGYIGYGEGGRLTEQVRRNPYSVILLDEIEKSHPNVQDLFLQVFDKGILVDSEGTAIDFKNTVILLTSNLGASAIKEFCAKRFKLEEDNEKEHFSDKPSNNILEARDENNSRAAQFESDTTSDTEKQDHESTEAKNDEKISEQSSDNDEQTDKLENIEEEEDDHDQKSENHDRSINDNELKELEAKVHVELLKSLRPEFIGRLVVIPYISLSKDILKGIIKIQLNKIDKRLKASHNADFIYTDEAVEKILSACKISPLGARQIEHIIKDEILPDLALVILDISSKNMIFQAIELSVRFNHFMLNAKRVRTIDT